ncbi:hypothetical protein G7046_g7776 [Stylonectria norvegica]|nr:hypothetical protein G7046_g7776 [Stylonectria norvegica]
MHLDEFLVLALSMNLQAIESESVFHSTLPPERFCCKVPHWRPSSLHFVGRRPASDRQNRQALRLAGAKIEANALPIHYRPGSQQEAVCKTTEVRRYDGTLRVDAETLTPANPANMNWSLSLMPQFQRPPPTTWASFSARLFCFSLITGPLKQTWLSSSHMALVEYRWVRRCHSPWRLASFNGCPRAFGTAIDYHNPPRLGASEAFLLHFAGKATHSSCLVTELEEPQTPASPLHQLSMGVGGVDTQLVQHLFGNPDKHPMSISWHLSFLGAITRPAAAAPSQAPSSCVSFDPGRAVSFLLEAPCVARDVRRRWEGASSFTRSKEPSVVLLRADCPLEHVNGARLATPARAKDG